MAGFQDFQDDFSGALISVQRSDGVGGWNEGRGEGGLEGGFDYHTALFGAGEATKVATLSPYLTTTPRRRLADDGNSSRSWLVQLMPSIGAILLTMTSQGWQNALQKSRPDHIGQ